MIDVIAATSQLGEWHEDEAFAFTSSKCYWKQQQILHKKQFSYISSNTVWRQGFTVEWKIKIIYRSLCLSIIVSAKMIAFMYVYRIWCLSKITFITSETIAIVLTVY